MQAWAALGGAALTIAACWAAGSLLIAWCGVKLSRVESVPLTFLTGASCLHLAVFAILAAKVGYKPVWWILLGGLIVAAVLTRTNRAESRDLPKNWMWLAFAAIFAVYSILYLANGWAPETSPDGSSYHLELVARYVRAHGFERIATNMYAGLGQGVEVLYIPAFAIGRHSAAALVHLGFLIALAWAIFAYGVRIGNPWCGAAAALLVYLSPVVGRDGTTAYIDVAAAAIVFAVFYWLEIWDAARDARLLMPIGLLAGYAYAAKYTAFVILPYALVFLAWRARKLRPLIVVTACAALMIAPWMLKDWIYFHDPIAPFAPEIFPNPYVHVFALQDWAEWLRHYDLPAFRQLPVDVTIRGRYTQGIIGPIFLLLPLALLALRRPIGWKLILPGLLFLAVYFGNIGTRFLIPCLPFFALALAIALENRVLLASLVVLHAVLSWPSVVPRYGERYLWRIQTFPYRAALRIVSQQQYLSEHLPDYQRGRVIEEKVPKGERVFAIDGIAGSAYLSHEVIDRFPSALGNTLWDILNTSWSPQNQPTRLLVFRFSGEAASRLRLLLNTAAAKGRFWNIQELRFFYHGFEVPRRSEWRLRAWPNPFEVQLAFDNSPVTRWRSWQTAAPGMYLDVDFGRIENVDEVRVETSVDSVWPADLAVQKFETGRWITLADRFEERQMKPQGSLRRAASYEFLARGIHYVVVGDQDIGAPEYYEDPAAWGFEVVARVQGATLFRIVP